MTLTLKQLQLWQQWAEHTFQGQRRGEEPLIDGVHRPSPGSQSFHPQLGYRCPRPCWGSARPSSGSQLGYRAGVGSLSQQGLPPHPPQWTGPAPQSRHRDGDHTFGHSSARRCCEPGLHPRGKAGWSKGLERKGEDGAGSGSDKCNPSLQLCVGSLVRREAKECRGLACG